MEDCKQLFLLIQSGIKGQKEASEAICGDVRYRKIARYVFEDFPKLAPAYDWEDVFMEAVVRLVLAAVNGKPAPENGKAYFRGICRFVCQEFLRELPKPIDPASVLFDYIHLNSDPSLRDKLTRYLNRLGDPCKTLLWLYYLEEPPVKEYKRLAETLNQLKKDAAKTIAPESIPTTLTRCRDKFGGILSNHRDDLFE